MIIDRQHRSCGACQKRYFKYKYPMNLLLNEVPSINKGLFWDSINNQTNQVICSTCFVKKIKGANYD